MNLSHVLESMDVLEVATGFQRAGGPVWHPADCYLLFSDIAADAIYRYEVGAEPRPWRKPSNNASGLTLDRQARLIACERGKRRISRTEADGSTVTLVARYQDQRLNSPYDAVVRSDGTVFFTDPSDGVRQEDQELPFDGVYSLSPGGDLVLLAADFNRPSGLAFSPDEATLYVADMAVKHIRAFDVAADGALANGRVFADLRTELPGGPAGIAIDEMGNLCVAGPGGIWIFHPEGELYGVARTPQQPASLAFGGPDFHTLYITAQTGLYSLRTLFEGLHVF
ncbi:MAG TPA: SMP-30/gluconolactonase/LRE family protein [Chloroflexi bacterium]|jgi:sugar lactone lactonase YvrE|nr:SMP-30/gluconolactonase/LRE family protein [Chloroflexota bacterium]